MIPRHLTTDKLDVLGLLAKKRNSWQLGTKIEQVFSEMQKVLKRIQIEFRRI